MFNVLNYIACIFFNINIILAINTFDMMASVIDCCYDDTDSMIVCYVPENINQFYRQK